MNVMNFLRFRLTLIPVAPVVRTRSQVHRSGIQIRCLSSADSSSPSPVSKEINELKKLIHRQDDMLARILSSIDSSANASQSKASMDLQASRKPVPEKINDKDLKKNPRVSISFILSISDHSFVS